MEMKKNRADFNGKWKKTPTQMEESDSETKIMAPIPI